MIREAVKPTLAWSQGAIGAWDRFWFTPTLPHTLALIRILTGAMLLYTHLVWSLDLLDFAGTNSWIPSDLARQWYAETDTYAWSHLFYIESSPLLLWVTHIASLVVFTMLMLGLFTRVTSVLAWLFAVSYCHRMSGALFGLDQVNTMLAMYLMIGPAGAAYSLDRWLAKRKAGAAPEVSPSVSGNVAIRLVQLHLCVIYLFGGIGKMRGFLWWDGSAVWYAVANPEYRSLDMTWMVYYPWLYAALTHVTVFWETFYCFLVWPKLTRPIALLLAVAVHGGIALFLGMITFGSAMLIANLAFISPQLLDAVVGRLTLARRVST